MSWKLTCMLQKYHKKYRNSVNSYVNSSVNILYKTKINSNLKYNMLLSHE